MLMEYRANINKALEMKVISWNDPRRAYYWMDKGEFSELLFSIKPGDIARKENLLLDYFKSDFESYKSLQKFLTTKKVESSESVHNDTPANKYSNLSDKALNDKAREKGIKLFPKKTRAKLEAELIAQDKLVEA